MAQKRDLRLRISSVPWVGGLATAGHQVTIEETQLWKATNMMGLLDGIKAKRPGLRQWGQTITIPDTTATGSTRTSFIDLIEGLTAFQVTDSSSSLISTTTNEGTVTTNVKGGSSNENYLLSHNVASLSAGSEWSVRFMFQGVNLPANTAADTVANTFAIRAQGVATSGKEFAIWSGGIYWKRNDDSKYTLVTGSVNAGLGGWNSIEIRVDDAAGKTTVFLNDVLLQTLTSADLKDVTLTGTSDFEMRWEVEGSVVTSGKQYSTRVATPMFNDTITTPFVAQTIKAVHDFQYLTSGGSNKRALLAAAGDYIYHDNDMLGAWRPLRSKSNSNIFFAPYRQTILWSDTNNGTIASLIQWDGSNDPKVLEDAPKFVFITEHQQRVWGVDRITPLRVYFSGDRQPDLYFSPAADNIETQFSTALDAGYIEIPGKSGDEVTALFGDYYGSIIVFTRHSVWRVTGFGVFSYQVTNISQDLGCAGPMAVDQVGNDLWFGGRQGVHSLAATEKFGDIAAAFPSAPVHNLWSQNPASEKTINGEALREMRLRYNPTLSTVYVALPLTGNQTAQNIYVYNRNTETWHGPWGIDSQAMESVEVASPIIEVMMHGGSAGKLGFTDEIFKGDFGAKFEGVLESAFLNGRSIDPRLPGYEKTWKKLRLYMLPRGKYDFTVEWETDFEVKVESKTFNQNDHAKLFMLDDQFRLDVSPDGVLHSLEELSVFETDLNVRGKALLFRIKQEDSAGDDLVPIGWDVEFTAGGYELE